MSVNRKFTKNERQKDGWIFVLNKANLDNYGFYGELEDLKNVLEGVGADVSEETDEDDNGVLFVTNASLQEMYEILNNYGIDEEDIDELLNGEDDDEDEDDDDDNFWDEDKEDDDDNFWDEDEEDEDNKKLNIKNKKKRKFTEDECEKDGWEFVLSPDDLDRYGFKGDLEDFKDALAEIDADVSEDMDEDYNDFYSIYNASYKEMYEILSKFGVKNIDKLLDEAS